jgi:hypothetical protein
MSINYYTTMHLANDRIEARLHQGYQSRLVHAAGRNRRLRSIRARVGAAIVAVVLALGAFVRSGRSDDEGQITKSADI